MLKKRIITFFLAIVMMLGTVISPVSATTIAEKSDLTKEANHQTVIENGKVYKIYKFKDLGIEKPEKFIHPKERVRAAGDFIPNSDHYYLQVNFGTIDLDLTKAFPGQRVYIHTFDTDERIAESEVITGEGKFKFIETEKYATLVGYDEDKIDFDNWYLKIPEEFSVDIRVKYGKSDDFYNENIILDLTQRATRAYRAEWYTNNNNRPEIKAEFNRRDNVKVQVDLNTRDYADNEYDSISQESAVAFWNGTEINWVKTGSSDLDKFNVQDPNSLKMFYLWIIDPDTGAKSPKGKLTKDGASYYYNVDGDHLKPWIATFREELKVKFNPNGATFDQAVKSEQPIGHSMKIGEAFGDLEAVTVPTKDQISDIPQKDNKDQEFVGWVIDEDNKDLDFSNGQNADKLVDPNGYEVKKNVTFYAVYAPKAQGKVAIQYVDATGTAIKDIYKVQDVDYPKFAEGNKGEDVDATSIPEPEFIGYKRSGDIFVTGKKYDENGRDTVEVPYEKLESIIPEKDDNGNDNPKVTEGVKKHYAKVIYQVATDDADKAKLQLDGVDATSSLVYYVNPLEGKTIAEVASVKAVSKDDNLYKVDANDMWTYDPDSITGTDQVISQARDDQDKVVETVITLTAKVADKTAAKFVDKLEPQDIRVWVEDPITWKDGIKLKEANEDLQKILNKTETKVTDESNRNSDAANLPNGKIGNLKVTFEDGSSIEVKDQTLYVAPHKNDNNTNLPEDAVKVDFKIGDGVTGEAKTEFVKPGTDVKEDAPTVSAKEGFKEPKWYKGDATTEATDDDYKVTFDAVFTAKAGQTDAQKYGDQLKAKDIVKWVGEQVDWTKGVEEIDGVTFKSVEDKSSRDTSAAGKFPGKLEVTFGDDSKATVDNQNLFVRAKKGDKVTPTPEDPGNYPTDKVEVKFVKGAGIESLNPENKVLAMKSGESIVADDYPEVTVKENFKTKTNKTDYYDVEPGVITEDKTITASTTEIGNGTAIVKFVDKDNNSLYPDTDEKLQIAGENYNQKLSGKDGVKITYDKSNAPKILGYKLTEKAPVISSENFAEGKEATITLEYEKLKDIIPGEGNTKPDGYVTVMFTAQEGAKLNGETTYYVNPKAGKTLNDITEPTVESTDATKYEVKTGDELWKPVLDKTDEITEDKTFEAQVTKIGEPNVTFPNVEIEKGGSKEVTPEVKDKYGKKVDEPGKPEVNEKPDGVNVTPNDDGTVTIEVPKDYNGPGTFTIKVTYKIDGKDVESEIKVTIKDKTTPTPQEPSVTYPDTNIDNGETKKVTPEIKGKDGKTTTPDTTPEVVQPGNGVIVTPNKDGSIDVTVPKDYDGPGTITVDVTVRVDGKDINTTLTIKVNSGDDSHRPEHDGEDIFDGLFKRHDYTPTYPVKTVVPEKTKEINKLWYIFHIDEYDYEEVRNYNSTSHKMDVTPVIRNERTMLPLRYVAEAINADVIWNAETRTATFTKDGLTASIQIDNDEIVLSNGKTVKMDSKPLNINDRILVSVVNVANVFGLTNGNTLDGVNQDIEWDHDTRTATIYIRR